MVSQIARPALPGSESRIEVPLRWHLLLLAAILCVHLATSGASSVLSGVASGGSVDRSVHGRSDPPAVSAPVGLPSLASSFRVDTVEVGKVIGTYGKLKEALRNPKSAWVYPGSSSGTAPGDTLASRSR
jgi:hypothetical protein